MKIPIASYICILLLGLLVGEARAVVTVTETSIVPWAKDGVGGIGSGTNNVIAVPGKTVVDGWVGDNYSKNMVDWSINGGQTVLSVDMNHKRTGMIYSEAATYSSDVRFTVDSIVPYEISAYYNVSDVGASGGNIVGFTIELGGTGSPLMFHTQVSHDTHNEQFVAGGADGDFDNSFQGSLTGILLPGKLYVFYAEIGISSNLHADPGATAVGNFTLKIGNVPEPSTLLLLGIGAMSVLGYRGRAS